MKKNKKAQAQNIETIITIFIVTVIIALAIAIFYNFQSKSLESLRITYTQNQAYNLLSTLPLAPELQYTEMGYDKSSIDSTKLLNANLKLTSNMKIEVIQLYPEKPAAICTTSNYPACSTYIIYNNPPAKLKNQEQVSVPVSLYYPLTKERAFANLAITIYY